MKKTLTSLVLFFIFLNPLFADDRNVKLDKLFDELKIENSDNVFEIEQEIWKIWSTHPSNDELTTLLGIGSKYVNNNQLSKAVEIFTEIILKDPNWAEAWNKRATVLYLMGEFQKSQNDIDKVLELEKRHFGALAGQGLVNIQLKNYEKAIKSYQNAMIVYPSINSAELMIKKIKDMINKESI